MIDKEIELIDELAEYYNDEIKGDLKKKEKSIKKTFQNLIKKEASNFQLISENSVQQSIYVSISSRVKRKDSFREKLIRKNLGLQIIDTLQLTSENLNSKKQEISNTIEMFDDIVGLRLVCDLNKDCPKALRMLKNNLSYLKSKKIQFLDGEMQTQPQKMKNGLNIYRLKGIYDDRIGFELQIKSKIDEAWGELDHFIFYKDYSFFPTKGTVQQTMNNVGKLLDEIESLLYDLRNSKDNYNKSLNQSIFLERIEKKFSDQIKKILGFSYQLEKLSGIIKLFTEVEKYEISDLVELPPLSFDFLNFDVAGFELYLSSRSLSFELQLLESIYQIVWEAKRNKKLNQSNYEEFLKSFINIIKTNILTIVNTEEKLLDYSLEELEEDIIFLKGHNADERIWISASKYTGFYSMYSKADDLIKEAFEDEIEDEQISSDELKFIKHIVMLSYFEADIDKALNNQKVHSQKIIFRLKESLKDKYSRHIEYKQLIHHIDKISNSFQHEKRNIQI